MKNIFSFVAALSILSAAGAAAQQTGDFDPRIPAELQPSPAVRAAQASGGEIAPIVGKLTWVGVEPFSQQEPGRDAIRGESELYPAVLQALGNAAHRGMNYYQPFTATAYAAAFAKAEPAAVAGLSGRLDAALSPRASAFAARFVAKTQELAGDPVKIGTLCDMIDSAVQGISAGSRLEARVDAILASDPSGWLTLAQARDALASDGEFASQPVQIVRAPDYARSAIVVLIKSYYAGSAVTARLDSDGLYKGYKVFGTTD
ncbi:MAG: hypothetical protein ACHQ49_14305 [Elusimicrobiota bacterium]